MDERRDRLNAWCARRLGLPAVELWPASADASFRRYFRVRRGDGTFVAMDAPPEHGDQGQFLRVASLMREAGVHAPRVHAADLEQGFVLLEDLGERTYLDVMDESNADALFGDAVDALIRWQRATRRDALPPYGRDLLRAEMALFPDWYLGRHLDAGLDAADRAGLDETFRALEDAALAQPQVFVHRDYMPRNLVVSDPNPGVVDFQDAVHGPLTYDLLSLFKDAFVSWPGERIDAWIRSYRGKAGAAGLPVDGDDAAFRRAFDLMGVQRHLKVIGIFARLEYRDGKSGYLADTPRFFRYLRETAPRYPECRGLLRVLDVTGAEAGAAGAGAS